MGTVRVTNPLEYNGEMSKHFRRRIQAWRRETEREMIARVPAIRKYGLWALIVVIVFAFINVTRDQIVWNILLWIGARLQDVSEWIIRFAVNHGVTTALILLCLWLGILATHAYFDTLPPRGIFFRPLDPNHSGERALSGFVVENRSGDDLENIWITYKNEKGNLKLNWGWNSTNHEFQDILNGKEMLMGWLWFQYETKQATVRNVAHYPIAIGVSEIELEFGATPKGQSPYIKPLYVTVEVTDTVARVIKVEW